MSQQKSRALVLLLLFLSWAPIAAAAEETSDGVFAELLNQLAEFLGLEAPADETGPNWPPFGLSAPAEEAGPVYLPGGAMVPADESGPNWTPGG